MSRFSKHFIGSLFSQQVIYAYGSGSALTTTLWLIWFALNNSWPEPKVFTADIAGLEVLLDMYIRVMLPIWIPPINRVEIGTVGLNCFFGLCYLAMWSEKYASATTGRSRRF